MAPRQAVHTDENTTGTPWQSILNVKVTLNSLPQSNTFTHGLVMGYHHVTL